MWLKAVLSFLIIQLTCPGSVIATNFVDFRQGCPGEVVEAPVGIIVNPGNATQLVCTVQLKPPSKDYYPEIFKFVHSADVKPFGGGFASCGKIELTSGEFKHSSNCHFVPKSYDALINSSSFNISINIPSLAANQNLSTFSIFPVARSNSGMSNYLITWIVIGIVLVAFLFGIGGVVLHWRKRHTRTPPEDFEALRLQVTEPIRTRQDNGKIYTELDRNDKVQQVDNQLPEKSEDPVEVHLSEILHETQIQGEGAQKRMKKVGTYEWEIGFRRPRAANRWQDAMRSRDSNVFICSSPPILLPNSFADNIKVVMATFLEVDNISVRIWLSNFEHARVENVSNKLSSLCRKSTTAIDLLNIIAYVKLLQSDNRSEVLAEGSKEDLILDRWITVVTVAKTNLIKKAEYIIVCLRMREPMYTDEQ